MSKYVDITVEDFIENIRKNGLLKITGSFFWYADEPYSVNDYRADKGSIIGACAFGQGLINSGAQYDFDSDDELVARLYHETYHLNDDFRETFSLSFDEIANRLLELFKGDLNTFIRFEAADWSFINE